MRIYTYIFIYNQKLHMCEGELDVYIARHITIQPEILNTRKTEIRSFPASQSE